MLSHINLKIQSPRLRGEAITPRLDTLLLSHTIDSTVYLVYSTVTDLAKFLGWSTSVPLMIAT